MNKSEQVRSAFKTGNYEIRKGKLFYRDNIDGWKEKKPDGKGLYQLKDEKGKLFLVTMQDILADFRAAKIPEPSAITKIKLPKNWGKIIPKPEKKEKSKPTKPKEKKPGRVAIRAAQITLIRKMLKEKNPPSINKISATIGINRFATRYIIKQIKEGKTLRYEN